MDIWLKELSNEDVELLRDGEDSPNCKFVFMTPIDDQGKYQNQTIYFYHEGVLCKFYVTRSGSYFTDYHYQVDGYRKDVPKSELILAFLEESKNVKKLVELVYAEGDTDASKFLDSLVPSLEKAEADGD